MQELNFIYLAKPVYGGWIAYTVHFIYKLLQANRYKIRLFKVSKSLEKFTRDFGYGLQYLNVPARACSLLKDKIIVTAIDKDFYYCLEYLDKKRTSICLHDPTEINDEVVRLVNGFKIITIRKSMQSFLKDTYRLESAFMFHPFYCYNKIVVKKQSGTSAVSTSRVDFDKHTDVILSANKILRNSGDACIKIYGAVNRIYAYHKLRDLEFEEHYHGTYEKLFEMHSSILGSARFMVDMSAIKNDGDGSQYTFLDAIYNECCLILNKDWFRQRRSSDYLLPGKNCITVSTPQELVDALKITEEARLSYVNNAKKLLSKHTDIINEEVVNVRF